MLGCHYTPDPRVDPFNTICEPFPRKRPSTKHDECAFLDVDKLIHSVISEMKYIHTNL